MTNTPEQVDSGSDQYQHVVVLVHGTFARSATWIRADSPLATAAATALGGNVLVTPFEWSGRNSHAARLWAGAELADRLVNSHKKALKHIVAHSHGGNVVAYALRTPGVRDAIASAVCLGTPFVVAEPRNLNSTLRLLRFATIGLAVWLALFVVLVLFGVVTLMVYSPHFGFIFGILLVLVCGVVCFLVARLGLRLTRYLKSQLVPRIRAIQQAIVASLQGSFEGLPVLNVRTRRDEAAGYLRLIEHIAGIPFQLWSPTALLWIVGLFTTVYVAFMGYVAFTSFRENHPWDEAVETLILVYFLYLAATVVAVLAVTLIALVLCALWPKIFRGHALGFGEDGFMKNWLVSISASTQPPNTERSHEELLNLKGRGLHHSLLYQDEHVLRSITDWLSAWAERKAGSPNPGGQRTPESARR